MNKFQIFIKLVEFTFTTSGEVLNPLEKDDGNPLHRPEKDEDLLHLKRDDDLRCQKLENLEGPARLPLTCRGCPRLSGILVSPNNLG